MAIHHTDELNNDITHLYGALLAHWNIRDAKGFAGQFTEQSHMIGFDGSQLNGRAEIESVFTEIFEMFPTGSYVAIVKASEVLNANTGLLLAVAGMVPQGQDDINPAVNAIHSITAVQEDGQWRIALFQNTPAAFHGRPELTEQLSEDLRRALYLKSSEN